MGFFTKKDISKVIESASSSQLRKTLGPVDLIILGIGSIIGSGVFVLTGIVAAKYAGPAVCLSYAMAGLVCIVVALTYTELATMLPTSGSIYTYCYVAFGEGIAWIMCSIIFFEMVVGGGLVAEGWSAYICDILASASINMPQSLTQGPFSGGIMDLPAFLITCFLTFVMYLGSNGSKTLRNVLVAIKIVAIFFFIIVGSQYFDAKRWDNFTQFGFSGIATGASILFFAFTGFGNIVTASEECKNPERDLSIGIIGAVVFSTIIYVLIGAVTTGMADYSILDNPKPLAVALKANGSMWGASIVSVGAVAGMTTVLMMDIYGFSRILYRASCDGLAPKFLSKIGAKTGAPDNAVIVVGLMIGLIGAFMPFQILGEISSVGALVDYMIISTIVVLFRVRLGNMKRPFKCPMVFFVAGLSWMLCIYLLSKQLFGADGSVQPVAIVCFWFLIASTAFYFVTSYMRR